MPCLNYQHLIDQQGARRNEQNILMRAGDDVHLAGHAGHQVFGRILQLQQRLCNAAFPDRLQAEWN